MADKSSSKPQQSDLFQRPQHQQQPDLFARPSASSSSPPLVVGNPSSSQQQQHIRPPISRGLSAEPPASLLSEDLLPGGGGPLHGFAGDIQGGRGGSMLFGPGNPDFNAGFEGRPGGGGGGLLRPPPGGGGHVPQARFDPYGPQNLGGDPNWDEAPMPGPPRPTANPPPPGKLGGWGSDFL